MSKTTVEKREEAVMKAIDALFSDTRVAQRETLAALINLQEEIDMKIDAIKADMKREVPDAR
jgi:hypothetical protein